ncbi:hypothetical protein TWF694_004215 [Orbilia ellipsospora]|uniref:CHAT domain-containing protein n=1 Tax=Orbilia ellipsospora TaxID=2528407 RepID=A0AAV9WXD7_9PEZI
MDRTMPIPFQIDSEMEDLISSLDFLELKDLAQIYKDATDPSQIELYIYICHAIFERSKISRYLATATQQAQGWEMTMDSHDPDAARRSKIQVGLTFKLMVPIGQSEKRNYEVAYNYGMATVIRLPPGHPKKIKLENLRGKNISMEEFTTNVEALEAMIPFFETALEFEGLSEGNRVIMLQSIADSYNKIYEVNKSVEALSKSIEFLERIEKSKGSGYHRRFDILRTLGNHLAQRAIDTTSVEDIDRAIDLSDILVTVAEENEASLAVDGEALRKANFTDIREQLMERPVRKQIRIIEKELDEILDTGDYDKAIEYQKNVAKSFPEGHALRPHVRMDNLLIERYKKRGTVQAVNQAIEVLSLLKSDETGDPLVEMIHGLGVLLATRYTITGQMEDLDQSIMLIRESLELTPLSMIPFHQLSVFLQVLGVKYTETETPEALENLELVTQKITSSPNLSVAEEIMLWGQMHYFRFRLTKSIEDCNNVIEILTPLLDIENLNGMIDKVARDILRGMHGVRYGHTGDIDSLEKQLKLSNYLQEDSESGDPGNLSALRTAGSFLTHRAYMEKYELYHSIEDLDKAHKIIQAAWEDSESLDMYHIIMGGGLAKILELKGDLQGASKVLEESVKHLLVITPRSLKNTDKQSVIGRNFGLASHAARAFLWAGRQPYEALQILELGRGIVTSLMLEIRTDVSSLEAEYPDLAKEFLHLRDVLDSPIADSLGFGSPGFMFENNGMIPQEAEKRKRRDAETRLIEVTEEIRSKNGFEGFLLPHTPEQLMAAADGCPLAIINVEEQQCHAFLVERHQIRAISLPRLDKSEIATKATLLKGADESEIWDVLEWLWDVVAHPILEALGFTSKPEGNEWPRIRWVPTGSLSQLPLHAAGKHLDDSDETVLDRVISSYSLSVKTLIYGQERKAPDLTVTNDALLVSMSKTTGHSDLYFAEKEIEVLGGLCPALGLTAKKPAHLQRDDVLSGLSCCGVFHFAGHGSFNRSDPSKSCLLLNDWETAPLTVSKLWEYKLQNNPRPPFLAYLSACSTGANDELRLSDEGINLVSAYQLAGFRHVIGTLWEVDDLYCVKIAKKIYETIRDVGGLKDENISLALHTALVALRGESLDNSSMRKARGQSRLVKLTKGLEIKDVNTAALKSVDATSDDGKQNREGQNKGDTRNAKMVRGKEELNFHWVPYVHFGV